MVNGSTQPESSDGGPSTACTAAITASGSSPKPATPMPSSPSTSSPPTRAVAGRSAVGAGLGRRRERSWAGSSAARGGGGGDDVVDVGGRGGGGRRGTSWADRAMVGGRRHRRPGGRRRRWTATTAACRRRRGSRCTHRAVRRRGLVEARSRRGLMRSIVTQHARLDRGTPGDGRSVTSAVGRAPCALGARASVGGRRRRRTRSARRSARRSMPQSASTSRVC